MKSYALTTGHCGAVIQNKPQLESRLNELLTGTDVCLFKDGFNEWHSNQRYKHGLLFLLLHRQVFVGTMNLNQHVSTSVKYTIRNQLKCTACCQNNRASVCCDLPMCSLSMVHLTTYLLLFLHSQNNTTSINCVLYL